MAPLCNAGGNERVNLLNRRRQIGPVGGVGSRRDNALRLDLNRDRMESDASETDAASALCRPG